VCHDTSSSSYSPEIRPDTFDGAAVRWHGRLGLEAPTLTLAESQYALAALATLCASDHAAVDALGRLPQRVRPRLLPGAA
jgi:hypothetical protein